MKNNIFELTTEELKNIAGSLQKKIEEGLEKDGMEISCIPTHIVPKKNIEEGKVLVLDWGGTNFRAAIAEFKDGKATIIETLPKDKKYPLSAKEVVGFDQNKLHETMAGWICELKKLDKDVTKIGYCFSYPAASRLNGDAILLRWTKGIDIPDMIEKPVGEPLMNFLNNYKGIKTKFTDIKVINDTVACLFAGLSEAGYDSYMGLIVGTGTNMASLMRLDKISKLKKDDSGSIPVNLESGNFYPPYLTVVDGLVDAMSNNKGQQRFEKAISGGYVGEIFKTVFINEKIAYDCDGGTLAKMIRNPEANVAEHVAVAGWIYERSAKLVAASLAGLVQVLVAQDASIKKICLAADGTVFWDKDKNNDLYYKELVEKELKLLLPKDVSVTISDKMEDPNLIGSAIAALS